ncbi:MULTISPECIES: hypothetical protein [Streptomyces]|uniref:Uncharacterized protein n=1 Tax=Streptomyces solicathayae TaxID=3081768 RepID=A0ABZ0LX62_9ACTN|nr:hypothetical protein [Streptomyces sp. HUAS YS2]WOX24002.1 hypothetical protein R2D22_22470 [Streptomyces sp. HUAS YS2]
MTSLTDRARGLWPEENRPWNPEASTSADLSSFLEQLTFASADEIVAMLDDQAPYLVDGQMSVWARNLAYRLACLQRPDDPGLLRAAGDSLYLHGPDWDDTALELKRRADELDGGVPESD